VPWQPRGNVGALSWWTMPLSSWRTCLQLGTKVLHIHACSTAPPK
jgi:hypothetical protein